MTAVLVFSALVTGIVTAVAVAARKYHLDDLTRN